MRTRALLGAAVAALAVAVGVTVAPDESKSRCTSSDYSLNCVHAKRAPALGFGLPAKAYGIDFGWGGPSVAFMHSHGLRFAASYLSTDPSKNWRLAQVRAYHAAGIATVAVWETTAARALSGYWAGRSDAQQARGQAAYLGDTRVVYFAVDFDESPSQTSVVASYFQGVDSVLGVAHDGAYGGFWTVKRLLDAHLIAYAWQTYAWSGGLWDPRAQLEQYQNGESVDWDKAIALDYGQWPYAVPSRPPVPPPGKHPLPVKHLRARIILLRHLAREHGCYVRHHKKHACLVWGSEVRRLEFA